MPVNLCREINLPKISDYRGSLSFAEGGRHIPFEIKRVFYIYDVPSGMVRGGHAHKTLHEFVVAIHGRVTVRLRDECLEKDYVLSDPSVGLYINPMTWLDMFDISDDAVCMVFASDLYFESDYIKDYSVFLSMIRG